MVSGAVELASAALLIAPQTRRLGGRLSTWLLLAVFPANVQMALHPETFPEFSARALWLRLPLQAVMIAWAYWYTRKNRGDRRDR